tara:strand:- start:77 stop:424 length:348 start_codon:yes stop_codon:yes gene_type:complete
MNYINLESVGSTLTKDLKVFPIDISEEPETSSEVDEMMGVHIYDLDNEWFENLSSDDLNSFFNFLEEVNKGNMVMSVYNEWKRNIWSHWEDVNNSYMNLEDMPGFEGTWKELGSL